LLATDTATPDLYSFPYTTLFRSCPEPTVGLRVRQGRVYGSGRGATLSTLRRQPGLADGDPPTGPGARGGGARGADFRAGSTGRRDRKSTRLNSSHVKISYAVFCL